MKKIYLSLIAFLLPLMASAQGWPANYGGVMLQGFYWDSFKDSRWTKLESQADEISEYFGLLWIPQSGNCDGSSMGYNPKYYWDQNSSFGTESELRSLISTLKSKGTGTIADVVINHRQNKSNWVDFPAEEYKGVTYEMVSTDICKDDDGGETAKHTEGLSLSPNNDSGEGWNGMRDLDHASSNVQTIIKAYEDYLLNDLGYTGFRYDVAKGFAAKYFGLYNSTAKPQFSVGEVWDGNDVIKNWINGTRTDGTNTFDEPQSAAFDFQFRYNVRDAVNNSDWTTLCSTNNPMSSADYRRYAVTFVENHDTEKRKNADQDPILKDTLAANAYLLSMPGTPCVFMTHWMAYKKEIKKMVAIRKMMGINNQSTYSFMGMTRKYAAVQVAGDNDRMIVVVGPDAVGYVKDGWKELTSGYEYKYLVEDSYDTAEFEAILKHIEETTEDPESGEFRIPSCATRQDGVYAYFEKPQNWGSDLNVWVWGDSNIYPDASWPGEVSRKDISEAGTSEYTGLSVYLWHYTGTEPAPANIIFNDGTSKTDDLVFQNGGYYNEDGLQGNVETGISSVVAEKSSSSAWYTIGGMRIAEPQTKGIYIHNGKKCVIE